MQVVNTHVNMYVYGAFCEVLCDQFWFRSLMAPDEGKETVSYPGSKGPYSTENVLDTGERDPDDLSSHPLASCRDLRSEAVQFLYTAVMQLLTMVLSVRLSVAF